VERTNALILGILFEDLLGYEVEMANLQKGDLGLNGDPLSGVL
jgi:hypothetical protein